MADPGRLTVSVTHADGSVTRWAADEPDSQNIPGGLSFSSSIPGGYADAQFTLPRKLTREYLDESLFDTVSIQGPGGQVAWEGRVARLPREHSDRPSLTVGCVGHVARLRDSTDFREVYVDQDKGKWTPATLQRKSNLVGASINVSEDVSVGLDASATALQLAINGTWTRSTRCEAWYDSGGLPLGSVYYAIKNGTNINTASPWDYYVSLSTDDVLTADDAANGTLASTPLTGTLAATTDTREWVRLRFQYTGAAGADNYAYTLLFTALAVYGNHGLTKRGTATSSIGQGFYASDIIADVLSRQCPDLAQDIEATAYSIPQAAYLEPCTAEDVVLDVNKFHQARWAVYDGPTFRYWFADPASATTWEARLADGARLSLEGDDSLSQYNAVIVRYTDVDGKQRSAGPTWATNVDYTSADLELTGDAASAHGLRRCAVLTVSTPLSNTDADGDTPAVQIGRMWLAEQALPQRRGSITVSGLIRHPTEGMVPVWRIKAGDFIRVSDRPGDEAREITQMSYDHESRTATLAVGGLPNKVESLLEMLASGVSAAGF